MKFTCNICGAENKTDADIADRELATCGSCRASMRFRSVVLVLSRALFGMDLKTSDFPVLKSLRGLGISDSDTYSGVLTDHFSYTNTFFHREPLFDLCRPDEREFGKYDFVICSEILEHVPAPVERAFQTLGRLLKPGGVLILTLPYAVAGDTIEHFADLHQIALAEIAGRTVLVNRSAEGKYEVFDRISFHGGEGSTLEMRVFSEADIRDKLAAAGFSTIRFDTAGNREFGVSYSGPCSLPILASTAPFSLSGSSISELTAQLVKARTILKAVRQSRWVRLGGLFGIGPRLTGWPK